MHRVIEQIEGMYRKIVLGGEQEVSITLSDGVRVRMYRVASALRIDVHGVLDK
jgi:hypothetical protein